MSRIVTWTFFTCEVLLLCGAIFSTWFIKDYAAAFSCVSLAYITGIMRNQFERADYQSKINDLEGTIDVLVEDENAF